MDKRIANLYLTARRAGVCLDGPTPDSRPMLQAVVYLCQALGRPLQYRFLPSPIGPLSDQLSIDHAAYCENPQRHRDETAGHGATAPLRRHRRPSTETQVTGPRRRSCTPLDANRCTHPHDVANPRHRLRRRRPKRSPKRSPQSPTSWCPSCTSWTTAASNRSPKTRPQPTKTGARYAHETEAVIGKMPAGTKRRQTLHARLPAARQRPADAGPKPATPSC